MAVVGEMHVGKGREEKGGKPTRAASHARCARRAHLARERVALGSREGSQARASCVQASSSRAWLPSREPVAPRGSTSWCDSWCPSHQEAVRSAALIFFSFVHNFLMCDTFNLYQINGQIKISIA